MEKIYVVTGNFGSGKTELALQLALAAAAGGGPATLVDMDMINPYFRAAERRQALAQAGVRLIAPRYAGAHVELRTVDPRVYAAFAPGPGVAVFDAGGDHVGARALGQYQGNFQRMAEENLHVWLVVNVHRPLSSTPARILRQIELIEQAARLPIRGLVNNSNLAAETTAWHLLAGCPVLAEVSAKSGKPVLLTCGRPQVLADFSRLAAARGIAPQHIGRLQGLDQRMHRDMESFAEFGL